MYLILIKHIICINWDYDNSKSVNLIFNLCAIVNMWGNVARTLLAD